MAVNSRMPSTAPLTLFFSRSNITPKVVSAEVLDQTGNARARRSDQLDRASKATIATNRTTTGGCRRLSEIDEVDDSI